LERPSIDYGIWQGSCPVKLSGSIGVRA
jgi:hypothetical protein